MTPIPWLDIANTLIIDISRTSTLYNSTNITSKYSTFYQRLKDKQELAKIRTNKKMTKVGFNFTFKKLTVQMV